MNQREIDDLARAVAAKLLSKQVRRSPPRGADGGVPVLPIRRPLAGAPSVDATRPRVVAEAPRPAHVLRVADYIDHTLLRAEARKAEIDQLCAEARQYRFAAVCVNGCWAAHCVELLEGSGVKVAVVVGFPLGAMTSGAKAWEARQLVADGAEEIDMVAAIGHILDEDWDYVEDDIRAVVEAARERTVKVILETAALTPILIAKAAGIAKEAGAGFVKTSTGFHPAGGATVEAVALMRAAVGPRIGVKAAGGIRDCATALRMIAAGATRLGTSSGVKLVDCLGKDSQALSDLIAKPDQHDHACQTGSCENDAY